MPDPTLPPARLPDAEIERLVRAGTETLLARVLTVFGGEGGWAELLRAVAYELRDFLCEEEVRARAMMVEVLDSTPAAIAMRAQGTEALVELIDAGRLEAAEPKAIPRSVAEITAGVIYNRIHVGVEAGLETLDDEMVRE